MFKRNLIIATSRQHSVWRMLVLAVAITLLQPSSSSVAIAQDFKLQQQPAFVPEPAKQVMAQDFNDLPDPSEVSEDSQGFELPAQKKVTASELQQIQVDLSALQFQVRKTASARLKTLTTEDMGTLATALLDSPSAEALLRVHSELEMRYLAKSSAERIQASRLLEAMAKKNRLLSADPALHSLNKHWQTRIDVAFSELTSLGAIVRKGNFSRTDFGFRAQDSRPARQVLLTKSWTGGDSGLDIFRRLEALGGPIQSAKGIQVYLLSGHSLTPDQERKLIDIVGANRVQYRSVVALGITAERMTQGLFEGVTIKGVSKGGSAEKAGLEPGDFLLAMYGPGETVQPMKYEPDMWRTFRRPIPIPRKLPEDLLPQLPAPRPGLPQPRDQRQDVPAPLAPEAPADLTAAANPNRLLDFDQLVDGLKKYQPGDTVKLQVVKQFMSGQMFQRFPMMPQQRLPGDDPGKNEDTGKVVVIEVSLIGWADLPMVETGR